MWGFFNEILVRPLWNVLILITDLVPGYYLAAGIVILTVLIRLALLGPNAKAIRSQREMQRVNPELSKIKKQYAGNQQKIAEETMKLFKQHKVNPLGGCLPLLIQLPILWAFFWVLRHAGGDGAPEFYSFVSMPEMINKAFFWVQDVTQPDKVWIPILVGVSQFAQMKTITWHTKRRQKEAGLEVADQQQMAQNMMTWVMPVFIGFIARNLSAGLGIYWMTTALFSVGQQFWIAAHEKIKKNKNGGKSISAQPNLDSPKKVRVEVR